MSSTQILIKVKVEVVEPHFKVDTKTHMVDIINMMVRLMEVDEEILEEGEVMEAMVNVIKVNNQTMIQTITIAGNLGTWQIIIIKWNMMHGMKKYNK
jgi:aspartate 1-decarboxylase